MWKKWQAQATDERKRKPMTESGELPKWYEQQGEPETRVDDEAIARMQKALRGE